MPLLLALFLGGCSTMIMTNDSASPPAKVPVKPETIDVLFLAYDHGDGRAFQKLLPELTKRGISWHVLAFGPAGTLFPDYKNATDLNNKLTLPVREHLHRDRYAALPVELRQQAVERFYPRLVISGMAHKGQFQLVRDFWEQGAWTIGFYDNMEPPQGQQWVAPWLEQSYPVTEELLVPDLHLPQNFPDNFTYKNSVIPVQHPALQEWENTFTFTDRALLRKQLHLDKRPIVVVAGGYGKDYQNSRALIARAARIRPDLQWLFAPHPRTINASHDELLLADDPLRTVLDVPTVQLATIADLLVTHRSTTGWMAAQMGIPVVFVRPESENQKHSNQRSQTVNSLSALLNATHRIVDNPSLDRPPAPERSHIRIVDIIEERLKVKQPKPPRVEVLIEDR